MKIVHVITRLLNGGADENTLASCNGSAANGDEVHLVVGQVVQDEIRAKLDPRVRFHSVKSMIHPISPLKDAQAFLALLSYFRRTRPDIVHTHTSKAGILGRAAAKLAGVRGIVHGVHIAPFLNVGARQRAVYLAAEKLAARWTHAFIDVSQGMRDAYIGEGIGSAEDHTIIYSGMDLERFQAQKQPDDIAAVLGTTADQPKPPVIVMLAALESRKRHLELFSVADDLLDAVPDARLVLGGGGQDFERIEAARLKLRNADRVRLLGFYPDPAGLIALADVCILCSTREGLPRVVVQYVAGGKPVVICRLPGIEEVISHGHNGIIVGEDDFAGLASSTAALLRDPGQLAAMTAAARDTDVSRWDVRRMWRDNEKVYRRVLGQTNVESAPSEKVPNA